MAGPYTVAPTLDDIADLGRDALATIPEEFKAFRDVPVFVLEFPDAETMADLELENPFDLLGLYRGVPVGDKTTGFMPQDLDRIFLFRRPLLDYWCETGEDLQQLVLETVIHEIGHHFGLSDDDMERIEASAAGDA